MKRIGHLIGEVSEMDNLRLAFYKAQRGKRGKDEIIAYRSNLENNLLNLHTQILLGEVETGKYKLFKIHDPKERVVCAAAFQERVLHHALMNVCGPYFERQMIATTYANRFNKGTYKALDYAHWAMRKYQYVAKLDVRKYFDSISHDILKKLLQRIFKDKTLLTIWDNIIDSYEVTNGRGLPIGNLTSQYWANYYLSGLDHYAKEKLRVPAYVRYMDDILLFTNEFSKLIKTVKEIEQYTENQLQLHLKTPVIQHTYKQLTFLGYSLCKGKIGLSHRSKKRFENKYRYAEKQLNSGLWTEEEYHAHILPLMAFVQHAYTKLYRKRIIQQVSVVGL